MTEAPAKMSRGLRILLIASLALNLAFVGLLVGSGLSGGKDNRPVRSVDVAIGPLGQALSREDRRRIGNALRDDPVMQQNSRRVLADSMREVVEILRADDFDAEAMRETMAGLRSRVGQVQDAAATAVIDTIADMTSEERLVLADELERQLDRPRRDRSDKR